MSQEEQRTMHEGLTNLESVKRTKARPLSLLILIAFAALASSCAGGDNSNSGAVVDRVQRPTQSANATSSNANTSVAMEEAMPREDESANGESYAKIDENPFLEASRAPLSTFSIDVDTASYSNTRRLLSEGRLPPKDAVRIEELINYFSYDYPQPTGNAPFSVTAEVANCPWNAQHKLVHIGLQGRRI